MNTFKLRWILCSLLMAGCATTPKGVQVSEMTDAQILSHFCRSGHSIRAVKRTLDTYIEPSSTAADDAAEEIDELFEAKVNDYKDWEPYTYSKQSTEDAFFLELRSRFVVSLPESIQEEHELDNLYCEANWVEGPCEPKPSIMIQRQRSINNAAFAAFTTVTEDRNERNLLKATHNVKLDMNAVCPYLVPVDSLKARYE